MDGARAAHPPRRRPIFCNCLNTVINDTAEKLEHIDILAIGYWTSAGDYEPPAQDYRQLMMSEKG